MTLETDAQAFIKKWEGCNLTVYKDIGGRLTVGIGHLLTPDDDLALGDTTTQAEADEYFDDDFSDALDALDSLVTAPLTDNQTIALLSFVFNLGAEALKTSTLLKLLNQSDYHGAALQFAFWNHCNHVVDKGLTNRRLAEQKLFTSTLDNT